MSGQCIKCGKEVKLVCNGCKTALGADGNLLEEAGYCGLTCQRAHWPYHAPACMDGRRRKTLYRAADLAQLLLCKVRERLWNTSINHVASDEDGNIMLYEAVYRGTKFVPFPNELFKNAQEKDAVLVNLTCRSALIYLHCLLMMMLRGEVARIDELYLSPKNNRRHIVTQCLSGNQDSNTAYRHSIVKITLKSGDQYALDVSGAQYGYPNPLTPWGRYFETRVEYIEATKSLGHHKRFHRYLERPEQGCEGIKTCNEEIAGVINSAIEKWQSENTKLKDMLRLQEEAFRHKREEFFASVEKSIEDKRDILEEARTRQIQFEMRKATELKPHRTKVFGKKGPTW
ncbi:MAG: hypothetical protein Q9163_005916 [Psora crenata]